MLVTLTKRNQITLPRELINENNINAYQQFEISIENDNIILKKLNTELGNKKEENKKDTIKKEKIGNRKIVSNINEIYKYNTPKIAPCNLIVRSDNRRIRQFCNECNGQLYNENKMNDDSCPFVNNKNNKNKETETETKLENLLEIKNNKIDVNEELITSKSKDIINDLNSNVHKLNNKLNKKIENITIKENINNKHVINKEDESKNTLKENTTLKPVRYKGFRVCSKCEELQNRGYLVNDDFCCRSCTIKDVTQYINNK